MSRALGVSACAPILAMSILVLGCGGQDGGDATVVDSQVDSRSDAGTAPDTSETSDLGARDSSDEDSSTDTRVGADAYDAACEPSCHWDCFGGAPLCVGGEVWSVGYGPRSCCHGGDPWPGPGPACTGSAPAHTCTRGCASGAIDARYAACFRVGPRGTPAPESYSSLPCAEDAPKNVGDACAVDADCRPSATTDRLTCDSTSRTCALATRPPAPTGYGKTCGVTSALAGEWVVTGATCALCHVAVDAAGGCIRQACTIACTFDEDCPAGSVCICVASDPTSPLQTVCATATDRTTAAGRTAGLTCP